MKNSIKLLAALAVLGFAGTASAQSSASAQGTANATVVSPITLTAENPLSFGNIVGGNAGTISENNGTNTYSSAAISPNNTTTAINGGQNGTISDGTFLATGQAGFTFAITTPATASVTNGSTTLSAALASAATGTLTGGSATVTVTGVLTTTAAATTGSYTGTYNETVAYN